MLSTPVFGLGRGLLRMMSRDEKTLSESILWGEGKVLLCRVWYCGEDMMSHLFTVPKRLKEGRRRRSKWSLFGLWFRLRHSHPSKPKQTLAQIDWTDWIIKSVYCFFFVFNSGKGFFCNIIFFNCIQAFHQKLLIGPQVLCSEFFISSKIDFESIYKWYGSIIWLMQFHCTFAECI